MQPMLAMDDGMWIAVLAIGGGLSVGALGIISGMVTTISKTKAREETKRELAAYVAEGTISPQDAENMIKADMPKWERGCKS